MTKSVRAFAALDVSGEIVVWSIKGTARGVREEVGDAFDYEGAGWRNGWKYAQKSGYRVVKVLVQEL